MNMHFNMQHSDCYCIKGLSCCFPLLLLSYLFYDGAIDIQVWALLTKSQCRVSDSQVTGKALWASCILMNTCTCSHFNWKDSCTNGLYHKIYNSYWYCNTIILSIIHYVLFAMQGKFSWCAALWFLGYYFYVLGTYVYYSLRQQKNFLCVVL